MPSRKGGDPDVDWNKTSNNLRAALQNRGPLGLGSVGAVYKHSTGTDLKLNGHKLTACVKKGLFGGIILKKGTIALVGKDKDSNMAAGKCKPSSRPPLQSRGTGQDMAQNTKTRSLLSADSPVFHVSDKASWLSTIRAVSANANGTTVLRGLSAGKHVAISVAGKGLGTEEGAISLIEVRLESDWTELIAVQATDYSLVEHIGFRAFDVQCTCVAVNSEMEQCGRRLLFPHSDGKAGRVLSQHIFPNE